MDNSINKRKFYRIQFNNPMCTELTIRSCYGKVTKTGILNVCVDNVGPGGLAFLSTMSLPVNKEIVYNFRFSLLDKIQNIRGTIVRSNEEKEGIFSYGVMFDCNETEEQNIIRLFNEFSIVLKRKSKNINCKFCTDKKCLYKK